MATSCLNVVLLEHLSTYIHIVYSGFHALIAKLSICGRDLDSLKYLYSVLLRKVC